MGALPDSGYHRVNATSRERIKEELVPGSIICGLDDSESAKGAARVARGLSADLGLRLVFVHVVEAASSDEKITALVERLDELTESTTELDCGATWLVDAGHPADRLVATAAEEKATLIVVGSQGPRSPVHHSISAEISRRASCPVVVVPLGADEIRSNGQYRIHDSRLAGGIVRFGLGSSQAGGDSAFAGGIVRFNLGSGRNGPLPRQFDAVRRAD
jgi:nucleotide-binding universal stress UspA family protein